MFAVKVQTAKSRTTSQSALAQEASPVIRSSPAVSSPVRTFALQTLVGLELSASLEMTGLDLTDLFASARLASVVIL